MKMSLTLGKGYCILDVLAIANIAMPMTRFTILDGSDAKNATMVSESGQRYDVSNADGTLTIEAEAKGRQIPIGLVDIYNYAGGALPP